MMQIFNRTDKFKYLIYILIALIPLIIGVSVGELGIKGGVMIAVLSIGLPLILGSLLNVEFGISVIAVYSFMMSIIGRLANGAIPVGTVLDILMVVVLIGVMINKKYQDKSFIAHLKHPILIFFILDTCYTLFQALNPNAVNLIGWSNEVRFLVYKWAALIVFYNYFTSKNRLIRFGRLIIILSIIGAVYGIYHKMFGLFSFEDQWLRENPKRYNLIVLFGRMRIWSIFDGPTSYGLMMVYSAIFVFILAFSGAFEIKKIVGFIIAGVLMLMGMVYSGTRTAFVAFPIGMALYFLITLNKPRTILISIVVMMIFGIIYFGPFYSAPIMRLRSAFEGTDDPSMNVRVVNRHRIQPYMYKHLLGGGPGTTGAAGQTSASSHPLSGFPTDSYYLRIALEKGVPGLVIIIGLILAVISTGINNYYQCRDPMLKTFLAAIVCSFFAICVANYTQEGFAFRPMDILILSTYVLVIKIRHLDGKNIN